MDQHIEKLIQAFPEALEQLRITDLERMDHTPFDSSVKAAWTARYLVSDLIDSPVEDRYADGGEQGRLMFFLGDTSDRDVGAKVKIEITINYYAYLELPHGTFGPDFAPTLDLSKTLYLWVPQSVSVTYDLATGVTTEDWDWAEFRRAPGQVTGLLITLSWWIAKQLSTPNAENK